MTSCQNKPTTDGATLHTHQYTQKQHGHQQHMKQPADTCLQAIISNRTMERTSLSALGMDAVHCTDHLSLETPRKLLPSLPCTTHPPICSIMHPVMNSSIHSIMQSLAQSFASHSFILVPIEFFQHFFALCPQCMCSCFVFAAQCQVSACLHAEAGNTAKPCSSLP